MEITKMKTLWYVVVFFVIWPVSRLGGVVSSPLLEGSMSGVPAGASPREASVAAWEASGGNSNLWSTSFVLWLSAGLLLFSCILFTCITVLLIKGKQSWTLIRIFGILSVIILSVFVLIVGYDDKQLLPIIGLFGSIVGYLLGKTADSDAPNKEKAEAVRD